MTRRLLIALTQRVDVSQTGERRDALDQAWAAMMEELGHVPLALSNSVGSADGYLAALAPDAVILTGGNDVATVPGAVSPAPERDRLEEAAISYCKRQNKPLLAVCRGLQMLNLYLGGTLEPAHGHVATSHAICSDILLGIGSVNSFHNWAVQSDGLAKGLVAVATAPDGTIEAVRHDRLPWFGVMWHPERPIANPAFHRGLVGAAIEGRVQEDFLA